MSKKILLAGAFALLPFAAFAQQGGGAVTGGAAGAATGAIVGGPVGAVVGGVTGAIAGGIAEQQQPQFRQYVVTRRVPSYRVQQQVQVGTVLPEQGVTYYEVPAEYGVRGYRYTVVNEVPVLVDPSTRRVVVAGEEKHLTPTEFDLLYALAIRPDVVMSRERLLADVWGYRDGLGARTVDSHVRALRRKLGSEVIRTVHGVGYSFEVPS